MTTEYIANNAKTTLNGAINNSQTTIVVNDSSLFPASAQFRLKIGTELLLVTDASSAPTYTVTRGIEGTSAATASDGTPVSCVLTKASLTNYITQNAATPGGSTTQIQFNSSGALAGSANLVWDGTNVVTSNVLSASGHNLTLKGADNLVTNGTGKDVDINGGTGQGGGSGGSIFLTPGDNGSGGNNGQIFFQGTANAGVLIADSISCPDILVVHGVNHSVQTNNGTGNLGGDSSFTYDGSVVTAPAFAGDGSALTSVPAAPGGSTTQIQYNSSGVLAGSANLTTDGVTLSTWNLVCLSNTGSAPPAAGSTSVGDRVLLYNDGATTNQCGIGINGFGSPWMYHFGSNGQVLIYCHTDPTGGGATVHAFDTSGFSTPGTITGSNLSGTNTGDQDLSSYATTASLSSYVLGSDLTTTLTSYATLTSLNAVAFSGAASDMSGLSVVAISGAYGDLTGRPTGYSGALNDSTSVKIADVVNGLITTVYF